MRHSIKYLFILFISMAGLISKAYATHNRAGEITYTQVGEYSYEVTLVTYTDSRSITADRPKVYIAWGDGDSTLVDRKSQETMSPANTFTWRNVYVARHQYLGPGTYHIHFWDPNRISDIVNIANSVSVPFYLESLLIIDPKQGLNRSPILLQPPIDYACTGQIFVHNPNAYDPDGDSLAFTLIPPRRWVDNDVPGYFRPPAHNFFTLDPFTGQLTWNYPEQQGIYNIAIRIDEYRKDPRTKKYIRIGYVIRDMQIIVRACNNRPPVISQLKDTCVEAGKNITLDVMVTATDPDTNPNPDVVTMTASGGPFLQKVKKAVLKPDPAVGTTKATAHFEWQVACEHIRKQPYRVVFRAVDDDPVVPLSDLKSLDIRVVGPAPKNLISTALGSTVTLHWDKPDCANAVGYLVYRRADSSYWNHAYCETGVPGYTGFVLIDTITNPNATTYTDDNNGIGLSAGIVYCYRVTALYLNPGQQEFTEGYASDETCIRLKKDVPVITNASVRTTSGTNGSIYVAWSKPSALDTVQNPGPYEYRLYRGTGFNGSNLQLIQTLPSATFAGLNDTTFIDTMLNTAGTPYTYRIDLYNTINGEKTYIGRTIMGSTIFLTIRKAHQKLELRWNLSVPWRNIYYVVEKRNDSSGLWDSIGATNTKFFADTGLENGKSYCYRIRSVGSYFSKGFVDPIINLSQVVCSSPRDTIRPCSPQLTSAAGNCDLRQSTLTWQIIHDDCSPDVGGFNIYYSPLLHNQFLQVGSVQGRNSSTFTDKREDLRPSMAGCYVITAVDTFGNESPYSDTICVDNCPLYRLPNVFTPNGDDYNDEFNPMPDFRFVESIDIHIYNRWGEEVFNATDPMIHWDGTDIKSGLPLANGVYFYICTVNELYLNGTKSRTIQGTVHLLR